MHLFQEKLDAFVQEREWDQFHSPKNLALDLCSEVGEVAEYFRWVTEEQSYVLDEETLEKVKEEIGDVLIALMQLARKLGLDPLQAAEEKLEKIGKRYPVDKCKGKCLKYTQYD